MRVILDAGCMMQKEETHQYLKEKLGFPEYYGKNLDALYDCLMDLNDTEVIFEHQENAGAYYQRVYQIFQETEKQNPGLRIG